MQTSFFHNKLPRDVLWTICRKTSNLQITHQKNVDKYDYLLPLIRNSYRSHSQPVTERSHHNQYTRSPAKIHPATKRNPRWSANKSRPTQNRLHKSLLIVFQEPEGSVESFVVFIILLIAFLRNKKPTTRRGKASCKGFPLQRDQRPNDGFFMLIAYFWPYRQYLWVTCRVRSYFLVVELNNSRFLKKSYM